MGELFGAAPSLPYQERVARLQSTGVALWDSLQACVRRGSSDASITEEVANDFPAFFAKYPNITHVFFNGKTAEKAFRCRALPALPKDRYICARLPSTSSARTISVEAKVHAWSVVRKALS
jgi:hypoxanthine-DNA glycosylase